MANLGFMKTTIDQSTEFATRAWGNLTNLWATVKKAELEAADGRRKNAPPYATSGSFLYVAYENSLVLYVGETSVSVKKRFLGDGSGSHSKKDWYRRVTHINYIKATHHNLPNKHRKFLEQALSIALNPEFYGKSNVTMDRESSTMAILSFQDSVSATPASQR